MSDDESRGVGLVFLLTFSLLFLATMCAGFGAGYAIGVERGHEMRAADVAEEGE